MEVRHNKDFTLINSYEINLFLNIFLNIFHNIQKNGKKAKYIYVNGQFLYIYIKIYIYIFFLIAHVNIKYI